jgi:hypothetical protein
VIFHLSMSNKGQPLPPGAFGLARRPDELLDLVSDAPEPRA